MAKYRVHRARKWHQCAECLRQIKPGTTYLYGFAVLDGQRTWGHFCERCCTNDFHREGSLGKEWVSLTNSPLGAS